LKGKPINQFRHGHATHPDWRIAAELVLAQIRAQSQNPTYEALHQQPSLLGIVYWTAQLDGQGAQIIDLLRAQTGVESWTGCCAYALCANDVEYIDEPALCVMLGDFPNDSVKIFSGRQRAPALDSKTETGALAAFSALVHADPNTPDLGDLVRDMAGLTESGFIFGGVASGRAETVSQIANDVLTGGLSGAMFASSVALRTRITQGCTPIGVERTVSACHQQFLQSLDHAPALDLMLTDLGIKDPVRSSRDGEVLIKALPVHKLREGLLVGIAPPRSERSGLADAGRFGDYAVRHVVGIDPINRTLALADEIRVGDRIVFCRRDGEAAQLDLEQMCAALQSELTSENKNIRGAHYVSCVARCNQAFSSNDPREALINELKVIASTLGEFPLIGFYANGEIARDNLYGYTGVLTVFTN
jgi:small ligand-binding sensory domain FIST